MVQDTLKGVRANNDTRAERNAELRARLENIRGEVSDQVNGLISELLNINPEDVLTDEEINAYIKEAFERFDEDNSGQLGDWEFVQAWLFLGLKGSETEIQNAFKEVDTDSSGLVNLNEFTTSIRNSVKHKVTLCV
jgi:Ca2+-binding EF-hand superfamily protein